MKENIIIYGLGVTGISSAKALSKIGYKVLIYVDKKDQQYYDSLNDLKDYGVSELANPKELVWDEIDYLLKSPGIRLDSPFIKLCLEHSLEVVSDIELAYRLWPEIKFLAITGTNGKTTTTHMLSNILSQAGLKNQIVGNIGVGLLWQVVNLGLDYYYVLEISSFQLASSKNFRAKIACLTNISPDHIDWHGSEEEYTKCKLQITKNQGLSDYIIVNSDDSSSELVKKATKAQVREISIKRSVESGTYCLGDEIFIDENPSSIRRADLALVGDHNLQNALFAIEMANCLNINVQSIRKAIQSFRAIEHRIEPVREIGGVMYYNDSKGTNVDSTLKALDGFKENVILIAGGYDKKASYDNLFIGRNNIKGLILFGQTKNDIANSAKKYGFESILVDDLEEAVYKARQIASSNDIILFSPACASWDMYKNFEERGLHFKELVNKL